jgi:N-acetylglucosaminyldiphosphoundecaprenol N-acetyl-beta-D-mannosaminyltransferase
MAKVDIFHISFDSLTKNRLLENLFFRILKGQKTFVVTANPEIVMHAQKDVEYKEIVNKADFVIADGYGVVLGSKILGDPVPERIAGFDLMCELLSIGNQKGWSAYFLGAKKEVVEKAVAKVKHEYPNLTIAGYHDGYFQDSTHIRDQIKRTKPDLIFVALGFPKQEKWIYKNLPDFEKGLFMGVGGSFDVLAGAVKRAPLIWQKMNLEWLYRLLQEPSRWRRMLVLPLFVYRVILERLKNNRN